MSDLRCAVYVAPPLPVHNSNGATWSPISCTLIYSAKQAVLVDTPITSAQAEDLVHWIKRIAPNRTLSYIYITHGHGDHFFGLPILLKYFPDAMPVATSAVVDHMVQQTGKEYFEFIWESRFPGQIYRPFSFANKLPESNQFLLEDQWLFQAIEVGQSDTYDTTVLWIPYLKLAVCGDVVYGQVHQFLGESNTQEKREAWKLALEKIKALNPVHVVGGHMQAEEMHGVWHLESTKRYIEDFEMVLKSKPQSPKEIIDAMNILYPDRIGAGALVFSAEAAFENLT